MAIPPWMEFMRLKNVALALPTVYVGSWMASPDGWLEQHIVGSTILALSVATFMGAGNGINDILDYENDKTNHPSRVLPSGRIEVDSAKKLVGVFSALSLISIITYSIMFYSENEYFPIATICIWLTAVSLIVTYEFGPKTKNKGFVGNLVISIMVGLVIMYGATTSESQFDSFIILVALTAMMINLAREILKDCEDIGGDRGRETLPMRIGIEKTRSISYVISLAGMILAALPYYLGLHGISIGLLLLQLPTILNIITLNGVIPSGDDRKAQLRLRIALATGLLGFVLTVAINQTSMISA